MEVRPVARVSDRLERVRDSLARAGADWLLAPASADFRWLTGAVARSTERLVLLALPAAGDPFCVVPRLEVGPLAAECPWLELEVWDEAEDPFARLERRLELGRRPRILLGEGLRVEPLLRLAAAASLEPAGALLAPLRAVKDAGELALMAQAARNADQVVEAAADTLRPGMTEREVARFSIARFETLGDSEPWAIVASGPNGSFPHHFTSERRLEQGDVVVLDVGAFTRGYGSDITRTYWLGDPPPDAPRVYEIVNAARAAAIEASRAGREPHAVDLAARAVIEAAGFGEHFTHRTGHGVGLEVHEPPYVVAGNTAPLARGMVHSVEPGIYLPGRFGVRLEDLVAVEECSARRLNQAPLDPRPPRLRS